MRKVLLGFGIVGTFCLVIAWAGRASAQSSGWIPTTNSASPVAALSQAAPAPVSPKPLPVTAPAALATADTNDSAAMAGSDFLIGGVSYAKVLYQEGNVWIRPPGETSFHLLSDDEPIPVDSVLYTGSAGVLDFATGPGMALRMVPETRVVVDELPQPATAAAPTATHPEASQVDVSKGTVFSALGREDGQPIDFEVRTPQGVAGARGTMFATSATSDGAEVSMLHGTVNFETPDHQTSQITAGQSQKISGAAGGKFLLGQRRALAPAASGEFFNHAGGLLEHASGYGVVRRNLGPDVARTLHERGYNLPTGMQQRFQNAGRMHFKNRPVFNRAYRPRAAGTGGKAGPATTYSGPVRHLTPQQEKEKERADEQERLRRRYPGENGNNGTDQNGGNGGNGANGGRWGR